MPVEVTRLVLGLMVAFFHRPIADFMLDQETSLVVMFRQRGVALPTLPGKDTVRNVYFAVGIGMATFELVRIWVLFLR
ncbi:MAG TPA: hypothetical protein VFA76_12025 [Terriglobales bacterium]|jgi:hypothetical protein|nr:hypothetical protein [Terriglobales bacterium]